MLFDNVYFLILPTRNLPAVTLVSDLIVANGGRIVEQNSDINKATIILINDSFIDINNNILLHMDIFDREVPPDYPLTLQLVNKYSLPCIPLSFIGRWLAGDHVDIVDMPTMSELIESPQSNEEYVSTGSESLNDEVRSIETILSDSDTQLTEREVSPSKTHLDDGVERKDGPRVFNEKIIQAIDALYRKYDTDGDVYRARSYKMAKMAIEECDFLILSGNQARENLDHIGPSIAKKIQEILDTGELKGLDIMGPCNQQLDYFKNCYGVGITLAKRWNDLNLKNFDHIVQKYPNEIRNSWKVILGWAFYEDWSKRIPRLECETHLAIVRTELARLSDDYKVELQGSYTRGKETCGDIDMLIYAQDCNDKIALSNILHSLVLGLFKKGYIQCYLQNDPEVMGYNLPLLRNLYSTCELRLPKALTPKSSFQPHPRKSFLGVKLPTADYKEFSSAPSNEKYSMLHQQDISLSRSVKNPTRDVPCRRLDLFTCKWEELGVAKLHYTGSGEFNRWLRLRAIDKGYMLTQHGLFMNDVLIESFDDKKIFKILGLKYIPNINRNDGPWKNRFEL